MSGIKEYFHQLIVAVGSGWNRFWFTPRDAYTLSILRVLTGLCALYFVASFTPDLTRWFGPDGILNAGATGRLSSIDGAVRSWRFSYLYLAQSPAALWTMHVGGLLVLLALTLGFFSRLANVAALIVVLAYIHRGPLLTGQFEVVLTMLLAYLCLGNTGRYLSLDAVVAGRTHRGAALAPGNSVASGIATNIASRLIQLHLAGLCVTMGLNMLAGEVWWQGEAMWWLMTRTESRLVDLTGLAHAFLLVNLWTHAVVAYQLVFGLLVWNPLARPLLLCCGILVWGSLALATGLVAWSAIMCVASCAFIRPASMRRLLNAAA